MKDKLQLGYGEGRLEITLPAGAKWRLIEPKNAPALDDLKEALVASLEKPVASAPLSQIARSAKRIVVVVSDNTRQTRTADFLPHLLDHLNSSGAADSAISILIAYGAHKRISDEAARELLGAEASRRARVYHPDCRDRASLVRLGETSQGVPVAVNRLLLESDLVVAAGAANYHYFAGYGGGRKMIVPGCAAFETILANHALILQPPGAGSELLNPNCASGALDGNPIHEAALEAARMVPNVFLVNVVLNPAGEICEFFSGDLDRAHRAACRAVDGIYKVTAPEPFDIVVASSGGYPHDVDLIQMHKGIHHAAQIVRDGGRLIFCGEARDGIGSPTFAQWFDYPDLDSMAAAIRKNYTLNAHTACVMREKAQRIRISLKSRLDGDFVARMGLEPIDDMQRAVNELIARSGSPSIAVVPNANLLLPIPAI